MYTLYWGVLSSSNFRASSSRLIFLVSMIVSFCPHSFAFVSIVNCFQPWSFPSGDLTIITSSGGVLAPATTPTVSVRPPSPFSTKKRVASKGFRDAAIWCFAAHNWKRQNKQRRKTWSSNVHGSVGNAQYYSPVCWPFRKGKIKFFKKDLFCTLMIENVWIFDRRVRLRSQSLNQLMMKLDIRNVWVTKELVDLYRRSYSLIVIWDALDGQNFKHFEG